jgi:acid phosphatase type 7
VTYNLVSSNRTFTVPTTTTIFTTDPGRNFSIHNAVMSGLSLDAEYSYVVGNPSCGYSSPRTFRTQRTSYPQYHVLLGDMGAAFAYSLCKECSSEETCVCAPNATAGIISEIDTADMILHVGDFAYDLNSNNGTTGDRFFSNIENVTSRVPYMISHGNHEDADDSLSRFTESWRHMPANNGTVTSINGEAPNNWFFSWDAGLVHYISISTEIQGGTSIVILFFTHTHTNKQTIISQAQC